ncbi:Nif3-like dinuclear metal center hexameric protein [Paenibacillus tritici]|uniref:GTP cyclohydrolase 1 type 2 homolog n=1 Tax=Paenibacillus tritici TaxID=1873425 RepID=A0ABX2DM42_9BACL|nr:Nif3-like dinuclear metal center hexameric protein [Paenibacillus tritici]NQX45108.1 Nif3-like dinuclear metal center hexameric protein [Paenibacillus tritici]QUL58337.1 Nif3-like dinuclear metal center hexameric protein [Paenibacillus tritici]
MTLTFGEVIRHLEAGIPEPHNTVDKLEPGAPETEVLGIVTAFSASHEVIEQALTLGANLIITHEGVYYSHQDRREGLENDSVFRQKSALIAGSGIGIYRFHDYVHRYTPDGIMEGLLRELEWEPYVERNLPHVSILSIPGMTVSEIAGYLKSKLHIPYIRAAGNLSARCSRVGVLVGYRGGGASTIPLYEQESLDLVIAGEGPEWETPEYIRDALRQGRDRALIMLGHAESEAPGMKLLAERLALRYPGVPVHFIPVQPVFHMV